jgi:solute carrier family 13 (sodium-dependent dicarboxylate transporter), member 2/3/5
MRFSRPRIALVAGPALFAAMLLLSEPAGMAPAAWRTAAAAVWMAVWWIGEAVPIPATALLPLALFPTLGIVKIREAAVPYANPVIFLFMGGFMIAAALEQSGLHRRLALGVLLRVGTRPRSIVLGFMIATAFTSMWVSNTATAVMMLPIAISIVRLSEERGGAGDGFGTAALLGVAYGASIGGLGTLIGTPPNALLAGYLSSTHGIEIGFGRWMLLGVPLVLTGLPITWLLLTRVLFEVGTGEMSGGRALIEREIGELGPRSRHETVAASVTLLTAAAWIAQPLLEKALPWLSDAGIAIIGALLLFAIPVDLAKGKFALDWSGAEKVPWGVLILFGGGLSLAGATESTGLAKWIGEAMSGLSGAPTILVMVVITAVVIFLTELTSNTATAATFLPIVGGLAVGIGLAPTDLAIPAALAASCAFMLPVATPPNAIVYGSGRLTVPEMARAGVWLNIIFVILIVVAVTLLAPLVF